MKLINLECETHYMNNINSIKKRNTDKFQKFIRLKKYNTNC